MTNTMKAFLEEGRKLRQEVRKHGYYLIVEDSPDVLDLFKMVFDKCKDKFKAAINVDDALALIMNEPKKIQCVVIDLHVPDTAGIGGYRIIQHLESSRAGIPYVVHTGDAKLANEISKEYPRASVLIKGSGLPKLRELLGLDHG